MDTPESALRRPVAGYVTEQEGPYGAKHQTEVVVCDDGSVWYRRGYPPEWVEDHPIPGTPAAERKRMRV